MLVQRTIDSIIFFSYSAVMFEFLILGMVITNNGGKDITVRGILLSATADAPAKGLMQNFVQYNGFSGCPYCLEQGKSVRTSARGHTHAYPFNRDNPVKGYGTKRTHETPCSTHMMPTSQN